MDKRALRLLDPRHVVAHVLELAELLVLPWANAHYVFLVLATSWRMSLNFLQLTLSALPAPPWPPTGEHNQHEGAHFLDLAALLVCHGSVTFATS